ncbi:hypothetical protein UFOVP155_72 [uncultured Caudovirales phage]|uniref:Uncharacterized protein n=1 Tax=uncultured Caudovirales phage TaxID=2100421 RepID=A0A6J7WCA7_9CAUD|nr:hypothetical protein UFOVP155_72 [uncultured Caudovirales phage]
MTSMNEMFPSYTTDASFTKPEAMVVPCIWDNKQKIYVPVYSHRGVEIQNRIEELEAALREIVDMHPFKDPEGDAPVKVVVDVMFSINLVARAALGEKKDG